MKFIYCPICGSELSSREIGDEGVVPYCEQCHRPHFPQPIVCAIALIINEENEIVLIRQDYVSKEHYVFVAGHIKPGEKAEDSIIREIAEEIGIVPKSIDYLDSYVYNDQMLMLGYIAHVGKTKFTLSTEVDEAIWCDIKLAKTMLKDGVITNLMLDNFLLQMRKK